MDGVSRANQSNFNHPAGIGYITIPIDIDRDLYIKTCYRKERVAIQLDGGGGVINNCYISRQVIQDIVFPERAQGLGSCVAFIAIKHHNLPIIVGVISKSDETQLLEENSFKKIVSTKSANVSVEGKGKSGEVFINVESDFEGEGKIVINLKSKNNTAKFNVNCFGDINIYSEGKTTLKALKNVNFQKLKIEGSEQIISSEILLSDEGFELRDSFGNTISSNEDGEINVFPVSKLSIFEGSQPIPLGDTLQRELKKFQDRFNAFVNIYTSAVPVPSDGGAAIQLAVKTIMATKTAEDFDKINSEKSFTD